MAGKKVTPDIFANIYGEFKKIEWPTRKETLHLSLIVVIISGLLGLYIGGLDIIFTKFITFIVSR